MRVLLTGAAGFVGSRVRQRLAQAGHDVVATDLVGDVDLIGDLADAEFVGSLPAVEAVVHAAAVQYVTSPRPRFVRRGWFERNNVVATRNLRRRYDGVADYFLLVGTSMMYTQDNRAMYATDAPLSGEGVYSRSKLAALRELAGFDGAVGVLMPTIIGGPGRAGLFATFLGAMQRWSLAVRPGSGDIPMQMVHVDDVARLAALMVDRRAEGLFNAGGPGPLTILEWIGIIHDETGIDRCRTVPIAYWIIRAGAWVTAYRFLAREQVLMLGRAHVLDVTRSKELGWEPEHSNERILRDTARSLLTEQSRNAR